MTYEVVTYRDIQVHYLEELNGGGRTFGQAYVNLHGSGLEAAPGLLRDGRQASAPRSQTA